MTKVLDLFLIDGWKIVFKMILALLCCIQGLFLAISILYDR
ncbi:MAG: hypothetical protein P4M11_12935 [Candidatus Pacebacteria bacterium]|nr:hypothetical protein [Candidatus Paceibacterota bacterium]